MLFYHCLRVLNLKNSSGGTMKKFILFIGTISLVSGNSTAQVGIKEKLKKNMMAFGPQIVKSVAVVTAFVGVASLVYRNRRSLGFNGAPANSSSGQTPASRPRTRKRVVVEKK
jgi:hypothetical protein